MKFFSLLGVCVLFAGCSAVQQPNTNYAKIGLFQDRFDGMYYHYAETGKSIPINENNAVNASIGVQKGGTNDLTRSQNTQMYWEVNYQFTF